MAKKNRDDIENLAELVAVGSTVRDAAGELGISEAVAYRESSKPEFKARVSAIRTEKTEGLSALFLGAADSSIRTLVWACEDVELNPTDRIRAAIAIADRIIKFTEMTEMRRRLDELERRASEAYQES